MAHNLASRFRGFLPVVIDIESGGVDVHQDALLELAAITIKMDEEGFIHPDQTYHYHVLPFHGANLDPEALQFNKIDPYHPFRFAITEGEALKDLFAKIRKECKQKGCSRAVIVAHNAWFDQHFINAAVKREKITQSPFHRFTSLDTATLSALAYGQTVLSKALKAANLPFDTEEAHSALYDAECTAKLFCIIVNRWKNLGGWVIEA
ncbi:MAG: ribonuclease T [Candidatus Berkiellales bacterium]